jgi:hypothetical protein
MIEVKTKKALLIYSRWQYGYAPVLSNFVSNISGSYEYFAQNNPEYELENVYIGPEPGEIQTTQELSNVSIILSPARDAATPALAL